MIIAWSIITDLKGPAMKELHRPIRIGPLELRNRVVMPPIATYRSTEDGKATDELLAYYGALANNSRIGLIITEHSYVTLQGKAKARQLSIASDDDVDGLRKLTETIHSNGTKAFAQLNHAGSAAMPESSGMPAVAPSAVPLPVTPPLGRDTLPQELTVPEIRAIVLDFANAAARAKSAGYDGVEIHSAHGYLLNQFYSPLTNHRTDDYGGTLDNRLRFLLETVQTVREAVGNRYPISVRLGGCDYMHGGSTIQDSVRATVLLQDAGIDLLSVTGGMCRYTRAAHNEAGYFRDMSGEIKRNVTIPVLLTGGVKTVDEAEALLLEQAADLIGIGRAIMKNADWPIETEKQI